MWSFLITCFILLLNDWSFRATFLRCVLPLCVLIGFSFDDNAAPGAQPPEQPSSEGNDLQTTGSHHTPEPEPTERLLFSAGEPSGQDGSTGNHWGVSLPAGFSSWFIQNNCFLINKHNIKTWKQIISLLVLSWDWFLYLTSCNQYSSSAEVMK